MLRARYQDRASRMVAEASRLSHVYTFGPRQADRPSQPRPIEPCIDAEMGQVRHLYWGVKQDLGEFERMYH